MNTVAYNNRNSFSYCSRNQGVSRVILFLKAQGKNPPLPLSLVLVLAGDPWHSLACSCLTPIFVSVIPWPSSLHVFFSFFGVKLLYNVLLVSAVE